MANFKEQIADFTRQFVKESVGAVFWLKKTVTSSAILKATDTAITIASTGGELAIEDIVVKAAQAAGLNTGDSFRIVCDNAKGSIIVFVAKVSDLGTGKLMTMAGAKKFMDDFVGSDPVSDGVNQPTVLERGKVLSVNNEGADGLGDGTIDIYIKFRKLSDASDVKAA